MRRWRRIRISFWNLWFLCIAAGVLTGTLWANLLGGELLKQIGYFDGIWQSGRQRSREEERQLWGYVLRQRMWETGLGGLLAMTPLAQGAYLVLAFGLGLVSAVSITVFTMEKGWMGIGYWMASVLPQGICYLAVWLILTAAVKERQDLRKLRIWVLTAVLVAVGSALEVWVNPWLLYRIL